MDSVSVQLSDLQISDAQPGKTEFFNCHMEIFRPKEG